MDKEEAMRKDMYELAKHVCELSQKWGGIYIAAACVKGSDQSWATYGELLQNMWFYRDNPDYISFMD